MIDKITFTAGSPKVAGIILAAGQSSRFGGIKQLLPWKKANLVNTAIYTARTAGLDPIVVVLGANAAVIRATIQDEDVTTVENTYWAEGQSGSIRVGLEHIRQPVSGALILLADQPQVSVSLVVTLVEQARLGRDIVAPVINDQRANPVYFSAKTFDRLKAVSGDQGGRSLFSEYRADLVPFLDDWMAKDIDTPQDYSDLRSHYGLPPVSLNQVQSAGSDWAPPVIGNSR